MALVELLTDIADAIREKRGTTEKINAMAFPTEIANIQTGISFKITDLTSMFEGGVRTNQMDEILSICENVTSTQYLFFNAYSYTVPFDFSKLDMSKVSHMGDMFNNCGMTELNLEGVNTENVVNMGYAFGLKQITSIDLSPLNTGKVQYMNYLFCNANKLETVNMRLKDTHSLTTMSSMFYCNYKLKNVDFGDDFNTSNVTSADGMFRSCTELTDLDISMFDFGKVMGVGNIFYGCKELTNLRSFKNLGKGIRTLCTGEWSGIKFERFS